MSERLYLDHAATSPLHPDAAAELTSTSSGHLAAGAAAHERLARALGIVPGRLVPTLGGSQANARALRVLAARGSKRGRLQIFSQRSEHPSVLETLSELGEEGFGLEWLGLDASGRVDPAELQSRLGPETAFVSVMAANHETGTYQPTERLAEICRGAGVPFHCDAVQAFRFQGPADLPGDLLSLGGHKLGGPRGIGALILGPEVGAFGLESAGLTTTPLPSPGRVRALAAAIEAEGPSLGAEALAQSRDALQRELQVAIEGLEVNGGLEVRGRLPGHLSLSVPGLSGEALVLDLDLAGIAASSGAACSSGSEGPSPVLLAMGRTRAQATGSLRLTLGAPLSSAERARVVSALAASVIRLRALA